MNACIPVAAELRVFYSALLEQEGLPYVWPEESNKFSGKGFDWSKWPRGRDCSGCVMFALVKAGYIDARATANCSWMWITWHPLEAAKVLPGDFVFYRHDPQQRVSHVMTLVEDGRVFGASGGDSKTVTPAIAKAIDAKVKFQSGPRYRSDLCGYRQNPLRRYL